MKKLLVFKTIAFESGTTNSHNPGQDICHWQSIFHGRALRFNISLREIFSKSGSPRVMKKYDQSVLLKISEEFGTL